MIKLISQADKKAVDEIQSAISSIFPDYFIDRTKHNPNVGVDGTVGVYKTCENPPKPLMDMLKSLVPSSMGEEELDSIMINAYEPGSYLPPHRDRTPYPKVLIMFLNKGNSLVVGEEGRETEVEELPGKIIEIDPLTLHSVKRSDKLRFSIVYFYR